MDDGVWHHVGLTWRHQSGAVTLFLDGEIAAEGVLKPEAALEDDIWRIGFTASDFPEESPWFEGRLDDLHLYNRAFSPEEMYRLYQQLQEPPLIAAAVVEPIAGAKWRVDTERVSLHRPADTSASVLMWEGSESKLSDFARLAANGGLDPGSTLRD